MFKVQVDKCPYCKSGAIHKQSEPRRRPDEESMKCADCAAFSTRKGARVYPHHDKLDVRSSIAVVVRG